jgi:hypothetical protein
MKETKRVKWSETDKDVLRNYYPIGGSIKCMELLSCDRSIKAISKKARELGLSYHNSWTKDEIKLLKEKYPTSTTKELKELFPYRKREHLNCKARDLGIKCIIPRTNNGDGCLNFLDNLTRESSYWWGFILGDGHLSINNGLIISLHKKDKNHLEKLGYKLNVDVIDAKNKDLVRLFISRKVFSEKWISLMELPDNVTKTYYPPNILVFKEFYSELFIGLIDADGHIRFDRGYYSCSIELHCSWYKILELFKTILHDEHNISSTLNYSKKGKTAKLVIGNKDNIKKLKKLSHGLPCLKRKWEIIKI